jgi:hypothetical protein
MILFNTIWMINFSTVPETNKKYIDTMMKKKEKRWKKKKS